MGFETSLDVKYSIVSVIFEVSLWDLKQHIKNQIKFYGLGFEVSLWDLKPLKPLFVLLVVWNLKYPYGIWNFNFSRCWAFIDYIWSIPMGFETLISSLSSSSSSSFEVSLWDLKQIAFFIFVDSILIWSIPMGFETNFELFLKSFLSLFEVSLWDLKHDQFF